MEEQHGIRREASSRGGGGASSSSASLSSSSHSLAFRVMRLCKPALHLELPLKCHVDDLLHAEDEMHPAAVGRDGEQYFGARVNLEQPLDALGLSCLMVLPQSFGSIHLGETFCSYISVGNHSDHDVANVIVKAELQTEKHRSVLADTSKAPLDRIQAGGRHDFIIEHDIKEIGAHTLVCSASYVDFGEQKSLPQYFKFMASNPLSVRTKVRTVKDSTFLEACIENSSKSTLFLDSVHFEPSAVWQSTPLEPLRDAGDEDLPEHIRDLFTPLSLVKGSGGTRHFLFLLRRAAAAAASFDAAKADGSSTLGRLEIVWRSTLGEAGRLQTQQILGSPTPRKEVEIRILDIPKKILLETPFIMQCRLINNSDREIGPLRIVVARDDGAGIPRAIVVSGPWTMTVPPLKPSGTMDINMCLIALVGGVQRISGVGVVDARDNKPYDALPVTEVLVELPQKTVKNEVKPRQLACTINESIEESRQ